FPCSRICPGRWPCAQPGGIMPAPRLSRRAWPMRSEEEFARRLQRLDWDCRRGMKETEVMLAPFRRERFDALTREEQETFLDLLDCSDADLFAWFAGGERPQDAALARMVDLVLADAAA